MVHSSRASNSSSEMAAVSRHREQTQAQATQPSTPMQTTTTSRRPGRVPKRWHAQDNSALRSHIVGKLRKLFPALDRARLNTTSPPATTTTPATGASVVQRLEWMLYNAAHSRREYANECTLERRVQALVTQQLDTAAAAVEAPRASVSSQDRKPTAAHSSSSLPAAPSCQRSSCSKRPRRASLSAISIDESSLLDGSSSRTAERRTAPGACKRQRRGSFHATPSSFAALTASLATPPAPSAIATSAVADVATSSTLFLNNDLDLVAQVFAFLDGTDALRARAVNQFLAAHAPRMVHSLTLDARALSTARVRSSASGDGFVTGLLLRCTSLRRLVVTNSRNAPMSSSSVRSDLPRGYSAPRGADSWLLHGYELVAQVAAAFHRGACPALESLELRAPFEFATESDTIVECLGALAHRHTSQQRRGATVATATTTTLKRLVLDSTFLGDVRLTQLALLLERAAPYFCDLVSLVLRGNFAGEAGCHALFAALHRCPKLQTLDMSGNILTDTDAIALAHAIMCAGGTSSSPDSECESESCSQQQPLAMLQRLALHENFIGLDGFAALSSAVCTRLLALSDEEMDARAGARSLVRVSCAHNCAPVARAAQLFQF